MRHACMYIHLALMHVLRNRFQDLATVKFFEVSEFLLVMEKMVSCQ